MNTIISVSDFRNNLTNYLELLQTGNKVVIKNAKKDKTVVELMSSAPPEFDWDAYLEKVKKMAGSNFLAGDEQDWKKLRRNFTKRLVKFSRNG